MEHERGTRVDIYASGAHDELGSLRWLGCGSLVAPDVVVPHGQLSTDPGARVLCVVTYECGELVTGRAVPAADGSAASAITLDSPTGQPVQGAPDVQDPVTDQLDGTAQLQAQLDALAADSGCSHTPPHSTDRADLTQPALRGKPWYCRFFPTLPQCR